MGGGKGGSSTNVTERPLSAEELRLLSTQEVALREGMGIARDQNNLSKQNQSDWDSAYRSLETGAMSPFASRANGYNSDANILSASDYANAKTAYDAQALGYNNTLGSLNQQLSTISPTISTQNKKGGTTTSANPEYTALQNKISGIAGQLDSAKTSFGQKQQYVSDPNANLREALLYGNEDNARLVKSYENQFRDETGRANYGLERITNEANNRFGQLGMASQRELQSLYDKSIQTSDDYASRLSSAGAEVASLGKQSLADLKVEAAKYAGQRTARGQALDRDVRNIAKDYGKADADTLGRFKANYYAGVDSNFDNSLSDAEGMLARRGLSNSGAYAKTVGDMYANKASMMADVNSRAYNDAITTSDATRNNKIGTERGLFDSAMGIYGANENSGIGAINQGYANAMGGANTNINAISGAGNMAMSGLSAAGQASLNKYNTGTQTANAMYSNSINNNNNLYSRNMNVLSSGMQNATNANQQRIANLTGYSQLGRGMAGMAQNYLGQSAGTYGNAAQTSGSTANGIGGNNTSFMGAQMQANSQQSAGKGQMLGTAAGTGMAAYAAFSDERLKKNIERIGVTDHFILYRWDWNDEAKAIGAEQYPNWGIIAQDAQEIMPEAVIVRDDGYLMVDYSKVFGGSK